MPTLNFLFWNVQRKDLTPQLVNLAHNKQVDILILVENSVRTVDLILALNTFEPTYYINPAFICGKVIMISKFPEDFVDIIEEDNRMVTRRLTLPNVAPLLLTALHLPDKGNHNERSLRAGAEDVSRRLLAIEQELKISHHIVIGDFNMNPFEDGMIQASGFHGTMSSEVAATGSRTVQGRSYPYFYNPTWGLYGDLNKASAGTYYYKRAELVCHEWNLFDQVLLRPSLIPYFVKERLAVVEHDGVTSLLTSKNRPDKARYSDHLPLFFTLRF